MFSIFGSSIFLSIAGFFAIAVLLILIDKPGKTHVQQTEISFRELLADGQAVPRLITFVARDGTPLAYRHYPSSSDKVMILLHGSGGHSRYLYPLANFLSSEGLAEVYTPDLRGHGYAPQRRGDIDHIGQLDDDLADLIAMILGKRSYSMLILGGHSSGGGLAIRFAGSIYGRLPDAFLLLSPFLKYNAPTIRSRSGGWAQPNIRRIIGLEMLNAVGIRRWNYLPIIDFNMPEEVRDGTETLSYSYRLNTSYAPRNYKKDLRAIRGPLLIAAGTADEAFFADRFEPVVSRFAKADIALLKDVSHLGIVTDSAVHPVVREWVQRLKSS